MNADNEDLVRVTRADKLQINPQPLRVVPQHKRELMSDYEAWMKFRCQATTKQGYQCTRTQIAHSEFCRQHSHGRSDRVRS
jgi:hypothetical protein